MTNVVMIRRDRAGSATEQRMFVPPSHHEPELSPAQRYGLLIAAVVVALLGLATLDVTGSPVAKQRHEGDERSAECIVASAIVVGVSAALSR